MLLPITLPTRPTNRIFTGVAGTGKTYHLLQLQRLYDEEIISDDIHLRQLTPSLLTEYSWTQIVCAVFLLENRTLSIADITSHRLVQGKLQANTRQNNNIEQTIWNCLGKHSHPESTTVNTKNRAVNYYFDKDTDNRWYLLDEAKAPLQEALSELIQFYENQNQSPTAHQHLNNTISRSSFVSFHQAYGYDEFVEGIRPQVDTLTGQMHYNIKAGAFIQLCQRALQDPEHRYALFIDEINRANTAQVFGELMSIIEPDKRAGQATAMQVTLAYSGRQISVPSNVDIYASMNTQDHSLSALDDAFRRRFEFIEMRPDSSQLSIINASNTDNNDNDNDNNNNNDHNSVDLTLMMNAVNQRISDRLGTDKQLGQAYFYHINSLTELVQRMVRQILPQLIHTVKNSVSSAQQQDVMNYILYGNNAINELSVSLITIPEQQHKAMPYGITSSIARPLTIADDLLQVVAEIEAQNDSTTPSTTNSTTNSTAINNTMNKTADSTTMVGTHQQSVYLTAEPYRKIYLAK